MASALFVVHAFKEMGKQNSRGERRMSASMIKALILDGQEQLFKSPEKAENEAQFAAADNDADVVVTKVQGFKVLQSKNSATVGV